MKLNEKQPIEYEKKITTRHIIIKLFKTNDKE